MPETSPDDRQLAVAAALAGARVVREAFGNAVAEELKGAVDPVSEVDRATETVILTTIREARPHDAVLSEEAGGSTSTRGRRWIVDPLDGTVNFLHGIPHVAVSVGLWDGAAPLVAAVVDVLRGEVFSAAAGHGATCDGQPMSVSGRSELRASVVATGFPYDRDIHGGAYGSTVGRVLEQVRGVRRLGSAALDFAWVAAGRYDAYWEFNLSPWDAAAGILLVQEAGGTTVDLDGAPAQPEGTTFIATNAKLRSSFSALIQQSAPGHVRPTN